MRDSATGVTEAVAAAALAGSAGVAGSFLVAGATRSFVAAPFEALVVSALPGQVVATGIRLLGFVAEDVAFATAVVLSVATLGIVAPLVTRLVASRVVGVAVASAWAFGVAMAATGAPLAALGAALPVGGAVLLGWDLSPETDADVEDERRRWLRRVGAVLGFVAVAGAVGSRDRRSEPTGPRPEDRMAAVRDEAESHIAAAEGKSFDRPEMPGLVSSREAFYEVDINTVDPDVDPSAWSLSVTGAVDRELRLSMGDLLALPAEHRFVTLRCVSDPVDGELMDTALWTGIPASTVLDRAAPTGSWVMLRSVDGYEVGVPREALTDGFLAYGMNGAALPRAHGYPLRVLVPGHWGEVNAKWVEEIEVLESERKGYWERRGWHGTGPVHTISKVWGVNDRDDGVTELGGHAYAGTRDISRVEVLPGLGNEWREAELSAPLEGDDVWRQWRYEWESPEVGTYWVMVRAFDGEGNRQPKREQRPYPSGSTGWMRRPVTVGDTGPAYL